MNILAALRAEESKFLKQADNARQQLETVRAAIKLLSGRNSIGRSTRKKRFVSKAARARMARAQRARWAKVRAARKG